MFVNGYKGAGILVSEEQLNRGAAQVVRQGKAGSRYSSVLLPSEVTC